MSILFGAYGLICAAIFLCAKFFVKSGCFGAFIFLWAVCCLGLMLENYLWLIPYVLVAAICYIGYKK